MGKSPRQTNTAMQCLKKKITNTSFGILKKIANTSIHILNKHLKYFFRHFEEKGQALHLICQRTIANKINISFDILILTQNHLTKYAKSK